MGIDAQPFPTFSERKDLDGDSFFRRFATSARIGSGGRQPYGGRHRFTVFCFSPARHSTRTATPAPQRFRFQWCPVPISLSALTKLLDGLILLCAILFFAVMALGMTNILPTWPITILLAIGITAVFVTLYWFLFVFWIGSTPGEHLAQMACSESMKRTHGEQEDQPRFR